LSSDAALPDDGIPPALPMNFSALKRAHINRVVPEFLESDLEETFVRGTFHVMLSLIITIIPCLGSGPVRFSFEPF